jgi:hypothetical protein
VRSRVIALAALAAALLPAFVRAAEECPGPAECCADKPAEELAHPAVIGVGMVLVGLYNINEKAGTWDADYYLYESWEPQPGFVPRTEVVNEVARLSEQFGALARHGPRCIRSRRIRSTLSSSFDLRLFPFDRQKLTLQLSDSWLYAHEARYEDKPFVQGVDDTVAGQISQWAVGSTMQYARQIRPFNWEKGVWGDETPVYDYATFGVPVARHTTFHVTKFFLPLLVIVAVAMTVFWVDPEDLGSQAGIGMTCLLSAIAFQLAQASTLPEVAYLTLADLVYVASYLVIALALVESICCNLLARRGQKERAVRIDRISRVAFPVALAVMIGASVVFSLAQSH